MSKGKESYVPFLLSLCNLVLRSAGTSPGFEGRITNKGLDYACQEGVAVLQEELAKIQLPDFSGSFRVKALGKVDYSFYSLNIRSFQLPSSTIAPIPGVGLKVSISNAFAELTGDWKVKKRWLKDHGSFDLKVEGLGISVGLKLGSDATGRLTATTSGCGAHISDVRVHISGRLSWLYNLFHRNIESAFRKTMEGKICEEVNSAVSSQLEPFLQTLPARIDKISGIDYSLLEPPVATNDSVDLKLKGEFFSMTHRSPPPFPPPALDFPLDHDRMVYFGLSTYFFNTAGDVYYRAGAMDFTITDGMIPKEFKIRLNTSSFGAFIPQLEKLYPNMLMVLKVSPSSAPALTIAPEALSLSPEVDVQAFAVLPNSTLAPLFVIGASTTVSAKVTVSSTKIFGSLKMGRLQLSLKHSDVGPFSVQLMQTLMNYYAASILLPQMNARLAEGFPLPLPDHLQLSSIVLQPHKDFLFFGADVQYS
ncbi:bactericidal permeability-increasing protein-like isoform X2 [Sceloporus undulatus]|uniref:bactericidal permeability-increasing protein-like isoform X2 n=1 Tax=Sceloporus undulatus TaxID=8520 RepID=UPI001C4DA866|nr:bactericidal permeability-increasing protein-like isoform X2 [Sceloporus undulatus]